jgi:hypothetical protein
MFVLWEQTGCLCELYLADNKLPTVPASFLMNVKTLKVLVLKRNHISTLPAELGQLTRLTRLDLSDNRLFQLPVSVQYLTNLVEVGHAFVGIGGSGKVEHSVSCCVCVYSCTHQITTLRSCPRCRFLL